MHVAELMTTPPVTTRGDAGSVSVGPETDLATAADLLTSIGVPALLVVDTDGHLVGTVSRSDVLRTLASRQEPGRAELDPPVRRLLELTCRAPSVHNTQPWLWRVAGPTIELYADTSRRLPASDPDGRTMLISCGAALHHLQVAARGLGHRCTVERLPEGPRSTLLARVTVAPGLRVDDPDAQVDERHRKDLEESARDLAAIAARGTDRRRFTSWPVPEQRLDLLASIGSHEGCLVVPVVDPQQRHRLEELVERARALQASDPGLRDEQLRWAGRGGDDGVPEPALEGPATRFDDRPVIDPGGIERADGVLVLATTTDHVLDHLRTGETLSRIWLTATSGLLSLVPLSQVVEAPEIRRSLQQDVLGTVLSPQLLVRVGWQETSRDRLPPSPRRPLADVLLR
ncbi:Putative NAD(P)H nitroreductase [Nocardioides dokdonensis FR1436]|uniref:Putative NAD(P)H nitroreductase n=1 Tax=Nocardioides dokdonensis FR1436 TaxID=1300347 RepID=A0A1A9GNF3_9ACTN|nr:CBS domain-containing protein [Nocardioides dokdonensis]ANH39182.1 Putative NAD(P)H nitroreductase [Nocardioides dokdonensis FR1436]